VVECCVGIIELAKAIDFKEEFDFLEDNRTGRHFGLIFALCLELWV
jgi:hypothetical protein